MQSSKSRVTLKIPTWIGIELNTGIDRQIRAKEIGKHHKRVKEQSANIDNHTPRNTKYYKQLRQRLFLIQQNRFNKKIENDNIELLRHLITLSHDAPNYKTYPKSDHLKFSQRMNNLCRLRRKQEIENENRVLLNRLNSIKPSKSLTLINMEKEFKYHQKWQKQFENLQKHKREQPDVIKYKRPKLSKKEKCHFMTPLKRHNDGHNIDDSDKTIKHRKLIKQRPMSANIINNNDRMKRKRSNNNNKIKILNSPSYIIRPSKIYSHQFSKCFC